MIYIRKFRIVDDSGREFMFNQDRLISSPRGLGFSNNVSYLGVNNYYSNVGSTFNISSISFDIIFMKGYSDYSLFVSFIQDNGSKQFRFYYKVEESEKYCYVNIKQISKSELSSRVLIIGVELERTSHWLIDISKELILDPLRAGVTYPFSYPITYYDSNLGKGKIINNGVSKAPIKVNIKGFFTNPKLKMINSIGVINELEVNVVSNDNEGVLIIDSNPLKLEMTLTTNNVKSNVYQAQNFLKDNFLYIEKGVNDIEYMSGSVLSSECIISFAEEYLGI